MLEYHCAQLAFLKTYLSVENNNVAVYHHPFHNIAVLQSICCSLQRIKVQIEALAVLFAFDVQRSTDFVGSLQNRCAQFCYVEPRDAFRKREAHRDRAGHPQFAEMQRRITTDDSPVVYTLKNVCVKRMVKSFFFNGTYLAEKSQRLPSKFFLKRPCLESNRCRMPSKYFPSF